MWQITLEKKMIQCNSCGFLNRDYKNLGMLGCIGRCKKNKEFCVASDGCTFGKIVGNMFGDYWATNINSSDGLGAIVNR